MSDKLKPCPCCKGKAEKVKAGIAVFKIACENCGIQTELKFIFNEIDFDYLVKIWNTRKGKG
jgi:transcription elongation factor Elf1